jgi:hypothetical protein
MLCDEWDHEILFYIFTSLNVRCLYSLLPFNEVNSEKSCEKYKDYNINSIEFLNDYERWRILKMT